MWSSLSITGDRPPCKQKMELSAVRNAMPTDDRREGQVVEGIRQVLPHVRVAVFPQTLVEETVDLRDLPALVIASENRDALGISHWV